MARLWTITLCGVLACVACAAQPHKSDWSKYKPPSWQKYRARDAASPSDTSSTSEANAQRALDRFTFRFLKTESDQSLALRLLGEAGKRITFVDRHKDRWRYYRTDNDPIESIDLYTHPYALGSQYGLCGTEKYSVEFDDAGHIDSVRVTQRYGVEGAIFQKPDFDWDYYYKVMCQSVPTSHAPSYFPAPDSMIAQDVAMLLIPVIDLAGSSGPLPYRLDCRNFDGSACRDNTRRYLAQLHLDEIDELTAINCPLSGGPEKVCFTITTGDGQLGPYPKSITVKGSTYMNNVWVDSVSVVQGFTVS
jgi:hypothetical protein